MKLILLSAILTLSFSPLSYSQQTAIGCLDEQNRPRELILQVGKIITPKYIKDLKSTYPAISNVDNDLFESEHSLAHILCRANGCTRADSIKIQTLAQKNSNGFFIKRLDSVTCKQSTKNGWTTFSLNSAFNRNLRKQLPPVQSTSSASKKPSDNLRSNQRNGNSSETENGSLD